MTAHEIIIRPIVSERSFSGMELNKYTFEVAKDANKYQIKDAVEEIFGVKVKVRLDHVDVVSDPELIKEWGFNPDEVFEVVVFGHQA